MTTVDQAFEEADKVVHPVNQQWHYPILTKFGYVPVTKEAPGFVRSYMYTHPDTGRRFRLTTGTNADYWTDMHSEACGYWSDLEPHLKLVEATLKQRQGAS